MKCPRCGSENIEKKLSYTKTNRLDWGDGLGSPGILTLNVQIYSCKCCNNVWEKVE